jgi:hypothetical protein
MAMIPQGETYTAWHTKCTDISAASIRWSTLGLADASTSAMVALARTDHAGATTVSCAHTAVCVGVCHSVSCKRQYKFDFNLDGQVWFPSHGQNSYRYVRNCTRYGLRIGRPSAPSFTEPQFQALPGSVLLQQPTCSEGGGIRCRAQ